MTVFQDKLNSQAERIEELVQSLDDEQEDYKQKAIDTVIEIDKMYEKLDAKARSIPPGRNIQGYLKRWDNKLSLYDPDEDQPFQLWKTLEEFEAQLNEDKLQLDYLRTRDKVILMHRMNHLKANCQM